MKKNMIDYQWKCLLAIMAEIEAYSAHMDMLVSAAIDNNRELSKEESIGISLKELATVSHINGIQDEIDNHHARITGLLY
jgi:hypothetical protein